MYRYFLKECFCLFMLSLLVACVHEPSAHYEKLPALASTTEFPIPSEGEDIVGQPQVIRLKKYNTLSRLAYEYDVGIHEIRDANPKLKGYDLRPGTRVVIPSAFILPPPEYRKGIVINIAELRLYYFSEDEQYVMTFPVALGRSGWRTPLGRTRVTRKVEDPTWYPPQSIREDIFNRHGKELPKAVTPGKENPLGKYAIYLAMPGYLIHGTNDPSSIGRYVSSGCIRMQNRDVAELFAKVDKDTPVSIIYYPNKVGWQNGHLYLESHSPVENHNGLYAREILSPEKVFQKAQAKYHVVIDEGHVKNVIKQHLGVPTRIS